MRGKGKSSHTVHDLSDFEPVLDADVFGEVDDMLADRVLAIGGHGFCSNLMTFFFRV